MGKKQKLILINGRFLLQPTTGVQRYAREVINEIVRLNHPVYRIVIAVPDSQDIKPLSSVELIKDHTFMPTFLWQQLKLPLIMRRIKADLLWSPCNIGPVLVKNQVVSMHDASVFASSKWFTKKFIMYYRFILPLLGRTAKKLITFSNFSKRELIRIGITSEEKIFVIPHGTNHVFSQKKEKNLNSLYVLALGSRDPRKNIPRLIEAWKQLPLNLRHNRKLIITGARIHSFSQEAFKTIPDDVHFIDYIPDTELSSLYSKADLFVYPSLYEGFGLPPLEAMACGCPVIVSNVTSLPEVCGDAAYYIDPYSVESIAEGIEKILSDDDLRQSLIKQGLERARLFSWEESAQEHLKVLEEVLNT